VENPSCRAPLTELAGKSIKRTYKAKKMTSVLTNTDLLVEFEIKLDTKCGNKATVTRRARTITYSLWEIEKRCEPIVRESVDVVPARDFDGKWNIHVKSMLEQSDSIIFGPESSLVISVDDFKAEKHMGFVKYVPLDDDFPLSKYVCDLQKPWNQ
jgi:hypothetical protein